MATINYSSNIKSKHHHPRATNANHPWPEQHELIVTTQNGVYRRNATSQTVLRRLHNVHSTALATSGDRGSPHLLIAHDGRILTHDIRLGKSTTYRLRHNNVEIRTIIAVPDSQAFLFWTKRSNVIRAISCATRSLTPFSCIHPNEPTCVSISRNGRFVISCSRRPATVYLQDMENPKSQIPLRLRTTRSHVVVTTFHPERSAIFLLAHDDGTIAIHDARRILALRERGIKSDGLLQHVSGLHHHPIVAAVFLPGYRRRVVSLGSHGKCRITDMESTIILIVTWDIGSKCNALSTFQLPQSPTSTNNDMISSDETVKVKKSVAAIPKSDTVISVGCNDGAVKIYNSIGLLKRETLGAGDFVVDLHWIKMDEAFRFRNLKMDIVDIDWPPACSPSTSQESSKSLSSKKENHRLAQEIAKIELPLPPNSPQASPPKRSMAAAAPRAQQEVVKAPQRKSPPRISRRSPPRISRPNQGRSSQPNLLAAIRSKRQATTPTSATVPRKNLHEEPPGSSPREAQYIPGSWMSTPSNATTSSPLKMPNHTSHAKPSDFEARLMSGSLLAAELSLEVRKDRKPLVDGEVQKSPPSDRRPWRSDFDGALLASEQDRSHDKHSSFQKLISSSIHNPPQLGMSPSKKTLMPQRLRYGYSPEDDELVEEDADEAHFRRHLNHHRPPSIPIPPMPGHYTSSPSRSSSSGDDATLYEDAQEYGSHLFREPWLHQDVPSNGEQRCPENACNCNCADVVREEMALVRGEIASLRKTVWVLSAGLGVHEKVYR